MCSSDLVQRHDVFNARVVHEHVDAPESLHGVLHQRELVFAAAHIATEGGDGLACGLEFGLGLFQRGDIDVRQNDPEAILRQPLGNAFAQAVA